MSSKCTAAAMAGPLCSVRQRKRPTNSPWMRPSNRFTHTYITFLWIAFSNALHLWLLLSPNSIQKKMKWCLCALLNCVLSWMSSGCPVPPWWYSSETEGADSEGLQKRGFWSPCCHQRRSPWIRYPWSWPGDPVFSTKGVTSCQWSTRMVYNLT